MSSFYFEPSPLRSHKDKYYKTMTVHEKKFFKGMGYSLLCAMIDHMVDEGHLYDNEHITLEASGGCTTEDMEKLVNYYRSMSFKPWTENAKRLKLGYKDYHVPMIASVSDLQKTCTKNAKKLLY